MNNHTKPAGGSVGIVSAFSGQLASLPGVPFKGMWAGNWLLISAGMLFFFSCVISCFHKLAEKSSSFIHLVLKFAFTKKGTS